MKAGFVDLETNDISPELVSFGHIASAFSAGIVSPGDVLLKFGGALDILIAAETPTPDRRMFLDYHVVPGLFMPNGCIASGGSALN